MKQLELTLFYDSACPICAWEKRNLARKDKQKRIGFIDIHAPDFNPETYGVTMDELMGRLHALTSEGRMIKGVDTLIESYRAVGWWWAYKPIAMIPRAWAERAYAWFADHRYALSKRIGWMFGPVCQEDVCQKRLQSKAK
jgi:predicted DCC family thiol-disulfide oxidoreductase YuxK